MRDDVGFQSQQFAEQVANRRDRYQQQRIEAWQQIPQAAQQFHKQRLAEREMKMEEARNASALATDQLQRQQAADEIAWAQQLHTTQMARISRDSMEVDLELKRAQVERVKAEQAQVERPQWERMTERQILSSMVSGIKTQIVNGVPKAVESAPEEREWARKQLERMEQPAAARADSPAKRVKELADIIEMMETEGASDEELASVKQAMAEAISALTGKPAVKPMTEDQRLIDDVQKALQVFRNQIAPPDPSRR